MTQLDNLIFNKRMQTFFFLIENKKSLEIEKIASKL